MIRNDVIHWERSGFLITEPIVGVPVVPVTAYSYTRTFTRDESSLGVGVSHYVFGVRQDHGFRWSPARGTEWYRAE